MGALQEEESSEDQARVRADLERGDGQHEPVQLRHGRHADEAAEGRGREAEQHVAEPDQPRPHPGGAHDLLSGLIAHVGIVRRP